MFGNLRAARENLRRAFAAQFDEYQGRLVYRKMMRGQPIAVTEAERAAFIAEFEKFIPRYFWIFCGSLIALIVIVVAIDESGLLPMPDWVPMMSIMVILPLAIIAHRRAMTIPAKALAMRAPMGAERSDSEFAEASLRALPWASFVPTLFMGTVILGVMGYAFFANRVIFVEEPIWTSMATIFGAYLFFASLLSLYRKWKAEQTGPRKSGTDILN